MSVDIDMVRTIANMVRTRGLVLSDEERHRVYSALRESADEVDKLREFASYAMHEAWNDDGDYGSLQDKAEALGLIELRPIDEADSIDGEDEHYFLVWKEKYPGE